MITEDKGAIVARLNRARDILEQLFPEATGFFLALWQGSAEGDDVEVKGFNAIGSVGIHDAAGLLNTMIAQGGGHEHKTDPDPTSVQ